MSVYDVAIKVGAYSFTVHSTDTYDALDTVYVLDGLSIPWAFAKGAPFPSQPDPVQCVLRLATRDVVNLAGLEIGDPVQVKVTSAGTPIGSFTGRIVDPQVDLVRRGNSTWALYTIQCGDYNLDLAETALDLTRGVEGTGVRVQAIATAITAATGLPVTISGASHPQGIFEALQVVQSPALQLLVDALGQMNDFDPNAAAGVNQWRTFVVPTTTAGVLTGWDLTKSITQQFAQTWPPGQLALIAHVLQLVFPGVPPVALGGKALGLVCHPGRTVEGSIVWRETKGDPNEVVANSQTAGTVTVSNKQAGTRPVTLTIASTLTTAQAETDMAAMYLPDLDTARWLCDSFTWLPTDAELAALPFPLTPDTDTGNINCYWAQVAIDQIPDNVNPASDSGFYAGGLDGANLQIVDGRLFFVLSVRRRLPRPFGLGVTWADLRANFAGVKYRTGVNNIDPTLSWFEMRLARKA